MLIIRAFVAIWIAIFTGCWYDYTLACWHHVDSDRLENFTVTVSDQRWPVTIDQLNSPQFTRCGQYHGVPPSRATVTVTCNPEGILGRYLYIYSPNKEQILTICEAVIVGSELKSTDKTIMSIGKQDMRHSSEVQIEIKIKIFTGSYKKNGITPLSKILPLVYLLKVKWCRWC